MKKNKILIISIIAVAVLIVGIISAMFLTGRFDSLKESFADETTAADITETTDETLPVQGRPKASAPDSIVAAVYSELSDNSSEELSGFSKLGFNTVIFELNADNASDVSTLLGSAEKAGLFRGVRADISSDSAKTEEFVKQFNFDFVILSGCDETLSGYSEKISAICKAIKETDPSMAVGIEPIYASKVSDSVTGLVGSAVADFVFLSHDSGKDSAFKTAQTVWNEESCPLWLCHNLSGLSAFSTEKATAAVELISASADMSMCRALAFTPFSDISKATGTSAEIVLNYIAKRDTFLLDKSFSITNYSKTDITVEQSTITFRGTSSPAYDLVCNGKKLSVAKNGDFSLDCKLNPGKNTIKFEHKGKTYTYNVTYKIKLLKSVSPSEDISVPGGMLVEVSAVALKNASVSVSFNGKTYKMTAVNIESDSENALPDSASDFTTFTASLPTPDSKSSAQKLGSYKVTAKYSSLSESLTGAKVTVTAKVPVTSPPTPTTQTTAAKPTETSKPAETSSSGTAATSSDKPSVTNTPASSSESKTDAPADRLQKYFYTENYGLGSAKICEIIDDYVEVYPGNTTSTFSVPDCSPLLKGTVDYVVSETTLDGDTYYILSSGVKVPKARTERLASGNNGSITHVSIKNGYVMPKNSIKVLSCSAASGKTVIVLEMNRAVAFNAKLTGQSYSSYNGRPVAVSSLDCTGFEIVFSDTDSAQGSLSLMSSVCKSGKWTVNKADSTATLSFELANKGKFYGFHYEYNSDGNLVITLSHKPSESLSGYTIMLDPGHGGLDSGAVCAVSSSSFGLEKQINLSIATKIKELLEAEGAKVIMTRTSDKWVCYAERNGDVRNQNPDMFIAVHCDSSSSASAMGTSAFYYRAYSQPLAKAIHTSIVNAYKEEIYKNKSVEFKNKISRGASFYAFRVARVEECPAILIEYGFVSNPEECEILQAAENRDILAAATVKGIKNYIASA